MIGEGQLDDPTPPGWPVRRTTYLCTTSPLRILSKWPWISCCGDYWQQAELRTDGACRIIMMMMMSIYHTNKFLSDSDTVQFKIIPFNATDWLTKNVHTCYGMTHN